MIISQTQGTTYDEYLNFSFIYPAATWRQIEVDMLRTFPQEQWFKDKKGQASLSNVCRAYAIRNPQIGYS